MIRKILAAIVGMVVASIVFTLLQMVSTAMYAPEGFDASDPEAMAAYIEGLPATAFAIVLVGYLLGSLAGGAAAGKIGRTMGPVYAVIVLLVVGGVLNLMAVPQPLWFGAACMLGFVVCRWYGARLVGTGRGTPA